MNNVSSSSSVTILDTVKQPRSKAMKLSIGDSLLDLYQITSDVFSGGMGDVYRVHHSTWNIDLAMKQPRGQITDDLRKALFIKECDAWINLGLHPNIVCCYYVRDIDGIPSIFSEWMDGGSIRDIIQSGELYSASDKTMWTRILDIAIQSARGLDYAHQSGLIHQDVKPANILMSTDGTVKVTDFGLANAIAGLNASDGNRSNKTMLTPNGGYTLLYASPEQLAGKPLTRRTDIWSWAVTMLEILVGECSWSNGALAGIAYHEYLKQAKVNDIPSSLGKLLGQCFQNDESKRPHDFSVIEQELQRIHVSMVGRRYNRKPPENAVETAESLNNKALSYYDLGKIEDAKTIYEKALNIAPFQPQAYYNYTLLLWRTGEIDDVEAVRRMKTLLDQKSCDEAFIRFASILRESERNEKADEVLCHIHENTLAKELRSEYDRVFYSENVDSRQGFIQCKTSIITHICCHPLKKTITISDYDGAVFHEYELSSHKKVSELCIENGENDPIYCFAFVNKGAQYIVGRKSGIIDILDCITGNIVKSVSTEQYGPVYSITVSPDESHAIVVYHNGGYSDITVRIWNIVNDRCLGIYHHETSDTLMQIEMIQPRPYFVSNNEARIGLLYYAPEQAKYDRTGKSWHDKLKVEWNTVDVPSGGIKETAHEHRLDTYGVKYLPLFYLHNATIIVSVDNKKILFWDSQMRQVIRTICLDGFFINGCVSPDDAILYCTTLATSSGVWACPTVTHSFLADWALSRVISQLDSENNKERFSMLLTQAQEYAHKQEYSLALQCIDDAASIPGYDNNVELMALNRDIGKYCRIVGYRGSTTQRKKSDIKLYAQSSTLDSTKRYMLVKEYAERSCVVWDMAFICQKGYYKNYHGDEVAALFPNGTRAVTSCYEPRLGADYANNALSFSGSRYTYGIHDLPKGYTTSAMFSCGYLNYSNGMIGVSPDEKTIFSFIENKYAFLWNASDGSVRKELRHNFAVITSYAFSNDGQYLLTGHEDGRIVLWKTADGEMCKVYAGHSRERLIFNYVHGLEFFLNDEQFVSVGYDKTIRIWNTQTAENVLTIDNVQCYGSVSLSPDEQFILTSIPDIQLWDIHSGNEFCRIETDKEKPAFCTIGKYCFNKNYLVIAVQEEGFDFACIDWAYEFPGWSDWDDAALPIVKNFLARHPSPSRLDVDDLLLELQNRGFGWIRADGVRKKVQELCPKRGLLQGLFGKK